MEETVFVGLPNEGDIPMPISVVSKWNPKHIEYIGETCYFGDSMVQYSMKVEDFEKVFKEKLADRG